MARPVTLMVGVHPTPGTAWAPIAVPLAINIKIVGCKHLKMQGTIGSLNEEESVKLLKHPDCFLLYDPKFKDAASTMARHIKRLISYGVDLITIWIDESGLPEVIRLLHDYPELAPYLCGVIELTTTPLAETVKAHGCKRSAFVGKQAAEIAPHGLRNFIGAIADVQPIRKSVEKVLPKKRVRLLCPAVRLTGEPAGGQELVGTPQQAREVGADCVIAERYICDAPDPRVNYKILNDACVL